MITRIWKGRKEYAVNYYYCGQKYIESGRLKGCWKNITKEYKTEDEAEHAIIEDNPK